MQAAYARLAKTKGAMRWLALSFLPMAFAADAVEIEGIDVPPKAVVGGQKLVLNGAGVRSKFFFDIYVGALYLPRRTGSAEAAMTMPGPKRVAMHFIYHEVSRKKLVAGWEEGLTKNQPKAALAALRNRLDRFNALNDTVHAGDVILPDLLADGSTRVSINGRLQGSIAGKDFQRALLAVWLDKRLADRDLKRAMLGQ